MRFLVVPVMAFCVAGCVTVISPSPDAESISRDVTITEDPFRGTLRYQGPESKGTSSLVGSSDIEVFSMRAAQEKGRAVRYFIDVTDYYDGDWRGFDQVYDLEGNKFHALNTRHAVDCTVLCGYEEILEIEVPQEYLETHAETGTTLRLYGPGQASSTPFEISAGYIQGFLRGVFDTGMTPNPHHPAGQLFDSSHAIP